MSSRRSQIAPFHVMEVMRAAQDHESAGHEVLHLEVGQPGTPAPSGARAAAVAAIEAETLGYTAALGMLFDGLRWPHAAARRVVAARP